MHRTLWALLLTLIVAVSGCSGGDDTDDDTQSTPGPGTETPTAAPPGAGAEPTAGPPTYTNHTCDVVAGSAGVSSNGIGGCSLVTIESPQVYFAQEVPSGCTVEVDLDNDSFADEGAQLGKAYQPPASFTAFCDPGVVQVTVQITLASG